MVKEELIQRSPIRLLEQSINGGLKTGEIGIIASESGVGKTSVLVQLALDKLLQSKKVIHVSFTQHTHYVLSWYENIFDEFINKKNLENALDVKNEVVKNRVLMNFNQDVMSKDQILKSLRALIVEGGFNADAIIIDGFDFYRADYERIAAVKGFAEGLGLSVWYSCTVKTEDQKCDKSGFPLALKGYADMIDVVLLLEPKQDYIELTVCKDHGANNAKAPAMRLDPRTLLLL
ncbi:MAG: hypothetical protein FWG99_00230 [Treponema sp.]|nr:hypothetical protein [Treponema sp.]